MDLQKCKKCQQELELDRFSFENVSLAKRKKTCKGCMNKYNKAYHKKRWESDEAYRKRVAERSSKWQKSNPERRAKIAKRRNQKEKENKPERVQCRTLVNQRVRFGRMPKAKTLKCHYCGEQAAHYHHYLGYSFEHRYSVQPVCTKCHKTLG